METNEPKIEGYLFNSISYNSQEGLEKFLDNINLEQSLYVIQESINFSVANNIYSLTEIELLSKSLRILNKHIYNKE